MQVLYKKDQPLFCIRHQYGKPSKSIVLTGADSARVVFHDNDKFKWMLRLSPLASTIAGNKECIFYTKSLLKQVSRWAIVQNQICNCYG